MNNNIWNVILSESDSKGEKRISLGKNKIEFIEKVEYDDPDLVKFENLVFKIYKKDEEGQTIIVQLFQEDENCYKKEGGE